MSNFYSIIYFFFKMYQDAEKAELKRNEEMARKEEERRLEREKQDRQEAILRAKIQAEAERKQDQVVKAREVCAFYFFPFFFPPFFSHNLHFFLFSFFRNAGGKTTQAGGGGTRGKTTPGQRGRSACEEDAGRCKKASEDASAGTGQVESADDKREAATDTSTTPSRT